MPLSHEQFHEVIPPAPGTAPIPEGHIRYYHQTGEENLPSIREHGLLFAKAKGIEGPKGVWASHRPFYGDATQSATVEFHLPKDEGHIVSLQHDVTPDQILAIHEPWHEHVRYATEQEPSVGESILAGNEEWMHEDPTYSRVIAHIKGRSG
jgi:hypothetical protein